MNSTGLKHNSTFDELKQYYDEILNFDKSTYKSSNDEPTPIGCISEMISKIPIELWKKTDLSIADICCGNGNFHIPILFELLKYHDKKHILEQILSFNDINESRLENVRKVFCNDKYKLQITNQNYIEANDVDNGNDSDADNADDSDAEANASANASDAEANDADDAETTKKVLKPIKKLKTGMK